jgi:hypothetical protein
MQQIDFTSPSYGKWRWYENCCFFGVPLLTKEKVPLPCDSYIDGRITLCRESGETLRRNDGGKKVAQSKGKLTRRNKVLFELGEEDVAVVGNALHASVSF